MGQKSLEQQTVTGYKLKNTGEGVQVGENDDEVEKVTEEGALVNGCGRRIRNLHELMRTSLFEHRPFTVGTRSVRTPAVYRRDTINLNEDGNAKGSK